MHLFLSEHHTGGGHEAIVFVGKIDPRNPNGNHTSHPMEEGHYITTILLINTSPGVGPADRVLAHKIFDPKVDKTAEVKFTDLPHARFTAVAHCNLHGAWESVGHAAIPGAIFHGFSLFFHRFFLFFTVF